MKKKLAAIIAVMMSVSMLFTACTSKTDENDVTGNVITQEGSESNTDVDGSDANSPAVSGEEGAAETLSPDDVWEQIDQATTERVDVTVETVDYKDRYGYNQLNDNEKQLYEAILDAAKTCKFKVSVSDAVTDEVWAKIYGMVYNQEPQLFFMNSKIKTGKVYYIENDPDKIAAMQKEIDAVADKLVAEASTKGSTFEKLKVFHDYLVLSSTFEKKDGDDVELYNGSIYNAFAHSEGTQGSIQCSGYAKGMQYLCDKAGIESMVITGKNDSDFSHAWNVVKVDGAWYNIDATWDDPILKTADVNNIRYNYFLVPDEWIHNKTHFKVNQHTLSSSTITYFNPPACTETKLNYFVKNNLVYSDFTSADKAIKDALQKAADSKMRTAEIMVSSKDVYDQIISKATDYNSWIKDNSTKNSVKGIANDSNEYSLVIEFDVIYNS